MSTAITFLFFAQNQVDPSEFDDETPDVLRRRRCLRPLSSKSSVPDYSSEFFEDEDDDDFAEKNAVIQVKLDYVSCKNYF